MIERMYDIRDAKRRRANVRAALGTVGREKIIDEGAKAWLAEQRGLGERGELLVSITQFCFAATESPA